MKYYAHLNTNLEVIELISSATTITNEYYIEITESEYTSGNLVGMVYNTDGSGFSDVHYWVGSTDEMQYKRAGKVLSAKIDELQADINGKANTTDLHNHTNKSVLDSITAEKVSLWDNGTAGADGEDGATFTPSVSSDGVLSWSNNKGLANPAPVIIKGADGANGTNGIDGTNGVDGAKGDKGDKGDKGESGAVITASEILTKLKTVDGQNSGLDADMLDGHDTTYFATASQLAGKADANHTHSQYATNDDVEALETEVAGKADSTHTHAQGDITGLSTALSGKANATHSHAQSDITGLATALGNKANASHTHATSDITGLDTALSGKASASHTHSLDDVSETTAKKIMTADERTKLSGIATGANKYTHPTSHPASMITGLADVATSGSYNDLSDKPTSMTPTAHTHAQSDVTGLATALSGKADTGHTHSAASTTANGFMSKEDKTKLNGIATGANKTTVDTALSASSTNPVQNKVINTALAGKSNTNHNHNSAYIAKSLQMTADDGDVAVSWTNQDVVAKIKALPTGMYTAYAKAGTTNNPKTTESWRFLVHKTGATFGWVQAFGSLGSMFIGYVDSGTWKGWKCIFDADPAPLWTGAAYMSSPNSTPQTVTPSKKLSECRNGWLLLWSDYDKDTKKANDSDFVTTMIPKHNPTGGTWSGKAFYCDIPRYMGSNVNDVDTERRIIKSIYIHDNCIKGSFNNDKDERNDVVLRAVFEW